MLRDLPLLFSYSDAHKDTMAKLPANPLQFFRNCIRHSTLMGIAPEVGTGGMMIEGGWWGVEARLICPGFVHVAT